MKHHKFFGKFNEYPKSKRYGEMYSLHKQITEKPGGGDTYHHWDIDRNMWEYNLQMIMALGLGGDSTIRSITEAEALEFLNSLGVKDAKKRLFEDK